MRGSRAKQLREMARGNLPADAPHKQYARHRETGQIRLMNCVQAEHRRLKREYKQSRRKGRGAA